MDCLIVLNGQPPCPALLQAQAKRTQLWLCADGGLPAYTQAGLSPHLLLGDADSAPPQAWQAFVAAGGRVMTFPAKKDQTDGELAVRYALQQGAASITILGGLGGRVDHLLGNVGLLRLCAQHQVPACMMDEQCMLTALGPGSHTLHTQPGRVLSLWPLTPCTLSAWGGVEYPYTAPLEQTHTLGISNQTTASQVTLVVETGYALVYLARPFDEEQAAKP